MKIVFKKAHTHAGVRYQVGDTLEVSDFYSALLQKIGVARAEKSAPEASTENKAKAKRSK